jgi:hypothetical protein
VIRQASRGEISWREASAAVKAIQMGASMFLSEKMLRRAGVSDVAEEHPLGPTGGLPMEDLRLRRPVERAAITKHTRDRHGNPFTETTVEERFLEPAADIDPANDPVIAAELGIPKQVIREASLALPEIDSDGDPIPLDQALITEDDL